MSNPEDFSDLANQLTEFLKLKLGQAVSLSGDMARLQGGFDTDTYAFSIENAPTDFPQHLVLRHFQNRHESGRVVLESTIQNEAQKAGHPVPQVPIDSTGQFLNDRPFLIMERLEGSALGSQIEDESVLQQLPIIMAKLQLGLYKIGSTSLHTLLAESGANTSAMSPSAMLSRITHIANVTNEPELLAIKSWLEDNWPTQPQSPTICHGDFHPNNILYQDGKVTGLIDWGNVMFTHPEYDVAISRLIMSIGSPDWDPNTREAMQPMLDQLIAGDLAIYRAEAALDDDLIDYYAALRSAHAYMKVIGARRGIDLPYVAANGYAWALPKLFSVISNVIETNTGVKLATS
jgi:aminoglycoside phosphotransferase (APT) family kinase protein